MSAHVLRADARCLPLPDSSVDLVVTSPPYFGLRSYTDGGEHYAGQVGSEATPAEFVAALLDVTRECVRVLKPSGSLWVNLGDKYAGSYGTPPQSGFVRDGSNKKYARGRHAERVPHAAPTKSLMGLPWRYALACIDELGLILRAEVVWSKPNGLPESVTDRVRRSHEQWFHMVKEPRYFSAVDEVREEYADLADAKRPRLGMNQRVSPLGGSNLNTPGGNPLGKLPGSVWTIPTQPLRVPDHLGVDHFAAFPMEWPRRIISGWSPGGICVECGEGRRPVVQKERTNGEAVVIGAMFQPGQRTETADGKRHQFQTSAAITGYACACPSPDAPTRPAVVLDPFGGTGTTALVASTLGRTGISVDLSHDYGRLARWRTTDPGERARAAQTEKPAEQHPDQGDLLDLLGGDAA